MKSIPSKSSAILLMIGMLAGSLPLSADFSASVHLAEYRPGNTSYQLRASDLIGKAVVSSNNEEIGEVDDLLVRRSTAGIEAVLSVGGFLGIGDRLVAVPYDELRISVDGEELYYEATINTLNALEEFEYENDEQWATAVRGSPEGGLMDQLGVDKGDQGIDWNKLDNNWDTFKERAASKWNALTPADWETIKGNRKHILGILSERTGRSKGDLEIELGDMVDSF